MKLLKAAVLAGTLVGGLTVSGGAGAGEDNVRVYLYRTLFDDPTFVAKLPAGVKYYFGDQPVTVKSQIGPTGSRRLRPTPARKTPLSVACRQLAGDGLISMGKEALAKGGNAVIGIESVVQDQVMKSSDRYQCGVGLQMMKVSFNGVVAVVE